MSLLCVLISYFSRCLTLRDGVSRTQAKKTLGHIFFILWFPWFSGLASSPVLCLIDKWHKTRLWAFQAFHRSIRAPGNQHKGPLGLSDGPAPAFFLPLPHPHPLFQLCKANCCSRFSHLRIIEHASSCSQKTSSPSQIAYLSWNVTSFWNFSEIPPNTEYLFNIS